MRNCSKFVRLGVLLLAFLTLSAMAGCPGSSDYQRGGERDGPPDHSRPGAGGMRGAMGGGIGGMGGP